MPSLLEQLGIHGDFDWQDMAMCGKSDLIPNHDLFFDAYEEDPEIAKVVDEFCLSCPVMKQCSNFGFENKETGVWGAIYLIDGKQDKERNAHKTYDIWKRIQERHV